MPDSASARRPRRWWRMARAVLLLFAVLLLLAYAWAGTIAAGVAAGYLPWTATFRHGALTVRTVATAAGPAHVAGPAAPELQVTASPGVARSLADAASGRWLPPGLLRAGQNVAGELTLPLLRERPFTWQALLAGSAATPVAGLRVDHRDLTDFLRREGQTVLRIGGTPVMRCIYVVDWGRITGDDLPGQPALERRFKVVARGSILLLAGQAQRTVVVRRLAGHAWATLVPVPEGYQLRLRVAIEESDADPITLPVIGDARPLLLKQLESAANDGLAEGLEGVVLPPWFPSDLAADVMVE